VDGVGVLGMHDDEGVELRCLREGFAQLGGRERRELVDPGVDEEALEAKDAGLVQRSQVGHVARDRPAPEAHVHIGLVVGDGALLL
jgi:hypothetical protein